MSQFETPSTAIAALRAKVDYLTARVEKISTAAGQIRVDGSGTGETGVSRVHSHLGTGEGGVLASGTGFLHKLSGSYEHIQSKLDATVAPGATDDSAAGYAVGSLWIDVTADKAYVCLDAAATSAVWIETTQPGGGSGSMTTVKVDGVQVGDADIVTLDFGTGFDVTETPDTEINISLDHSELAFPAWLDTGITGAELEDLSDGGETALHTHAGGGGSHDLLSAQHTDTLAAAVADGSIIIGNVTPAWSELAASIPGSSGARNVLAIDNGEVRPTWQANTILVDADGDTKIQVEESADEDKIRMDVAGSEVFVINNAASWEIINQGASGSFTTLAFEKSVAGGAVGNNQPIGLIRAFPHDGAGFDAGAQISFSADEAHTATNHGQRIEFYTVPNASVTATLAMTIEQDQQVTFAGSISVDTINEKTGAVGVTIDGTLIKDATITGGSASGGDLQLFSTSHATVGDIKIGTQGATSGTKFVATGNEVRHVWDGDKGDDYQSFDTSTNTYTITIATVGGIIADIRTLQIPRTPLDLLNVDKTFGTGKTQTVKFISLGEEQDIGADTVTEATFTLDNIVGSGGTAGCSATAFAFTPTIQINQKGNAFIMCALFSNVSKWINVTGVTGARFGPMYVLNDQFTWTADTDALANTASIFEVFLHPTFATVNGGTFTVNNWTQVKAQAQAVGAGVTITNRRGLHVVETVGAGTITNMVGVDIDQFTHAGTLNIGIRNASPTVYTPDGSTQTIAAVGNAITVKSATTWLIDTDGSNYTLTSTPTIADGYDGQIIYIINVDVAQTITIQDEGTLGGSNLQLRSATEAIGPLSARQLIFSSSVGAWVQP